MIGGRVLLISPMDPAGEQILDDAAVEVLRPSSADIGELLELAAEANVIAVRALFPPEMLTHAPKLFGIVRHGVGYENVPVEEATRRGIMVANTPGINSEAVAEYCLAAMLHFTRRLGKVDRLFRGSGWSASRPIGDQITELAGKTVGLVGTGNIGQAVAQKCRAAFGMRALGVRRNKEQIARGIEQLPLEAVFEQSDFVVIACPLTAETSGLVAHKLLALMKPSAVLINVSRGGIVDETALADALRGRRIAGAAIDVYDVEPVESRHPLLALDNTLVTPHLAGMTVESMQRTAISVAQETLRLLAGERPRHFVNPQVWEKAQARRASILMGSP